MAQFIESFQQFTKKENAFVIKIDRLNQEPKLFENSKYYNFYVRIFVDIDPNWTRKNNIYTLDDINFVKYELHPTYKQAIRISEDRSKNFEIKVWTYGFYPIRATLFLKLAQTLDIRGEVRFPVSPEERLRNKGEVW